MAKKRKSQADRDLGQLQSDREWLIRTTLIGKGYVVKALDAATDPAIKKLFARHLVEMELAISGCRPAAEDVLRKLGAEVAALTSQRDAAHADGRDKGLMFAADICAKSDDSTNEQCARYIRRVAADERNDRVAARNGDLDDRFKED